MTKAAGSGSGRPAAGRAGYLPTRCRRCREAMFVMRPSEQRILAAIQAELSRVIRYDDESIVNDKWIRQRYDGGFPSFAPARKSAVGTAWHEAGHAVAAL